MSILDTITKPLDRMPIITITGEAGLGKTSLAATFPNPIFIRAEDGLQAIPIEHRPDALPVIESVDQLWEQLSALINDNHDYKTVVFDSVSQLETLFGEYIISSDPKKPKSLAQANGGYGAGYLAVSRLHGKVRSAAKALNDKGIAVVFIAHSDVITIEPPDNDPYSKYELRLHKKCVTHYVDNVDAVGFLKLETFTVGDDNKKKAVSTGKRVLVTYTTAANVSKNRYGITEDLPVAFGQNPLVDYVTTLKESSK